jgi:uncharacterized iron-regulated membrane protein
MLAWKSIFSTVYYSNKDIEPSIGLRNCLPLSALENLAIKALEAQTENKFDHADKIELKPPKGYINFTFKNGYNVQLDGATGAILRIDYKYGGWIQDLHDGSIVEDWTHDTIAGKKIYSTVMSLALLFLTISGIYLWYKPKQIKKAKQMK